MSRIGNVLGLSTGLIMLAAGLWACAAPSFSPRHLNILSDVPLFEQTEHQCGPAALASVINYWSARTTSTTMVSPDEIAAAFYSPTARGTLGMDLVLYSRRLGFTARSYAGSINDIRNHIDKGVPLILLVDLGSLLYQINHFMVAVGYTDEGIIVHSGRRQAMHMTTERLNKIWQRTGFWTLAVEPPRS